jgi:hypothetical protein
LLRIKKLALSRPLLTILALHHVKYTWVIPSELSWWNQLSNHIATMFPDIVLDSHYSASLPE